MKQTQTNASFNDDEETQPSLKHGVQLRKIKSAYELQIKPQRITQSNLFPARRSNYIDHLRNQAFVNNIRLRFLSEDGTVPNRCVPKRSQSAPVFSSATLHSLNQRQTADLHENRNFDRKCKSASHARGNLSSRGDSSFTRSPTRQSSKSSGCLETRRSIPVRKFYGKLGNGSQNQRVYSETNGVFFEVVGSGIKVPEHDIPGAYFSVLRKDYKRAVRGPETNHESGNVYEDNDVVTRERLDYERQTDELLQYYNSKTEPSSRKGSAIDIKFSGVRKYIATPSPVITHRHCAIPETQAPTASRAETTRRSEYFLHLNHRRIYGRQYVPAKPFVLISQQSVLHDKKSCFNQGALNKNGSLQKKCDCSVCQSGLNLETSRLTLSPSSERSVKTTCPSQSQRKFWVNPSGTLNEDDFKSHFEGDEEEEKEEESESDLLQETNKKRFTHRSEGSNFTGHMDGNGFLSRPVSPLDISQGHTEEKNV